MGCSNSVAESAYKNKNSPKPLRSKLSGTEGNLLEVIQEEAEKTAAESTRSPSNSVASLNSKLLRTRLSPRTSPRKLSNIHLTSPGRVSVDLHSPSSMASVSTQGTTRNFFEAVPLNTELKQERTQYVPVLQEKSLPDKAKLLYEELPSLLEAEDWKMVINLSDLKVSKKSLPIISMNGLLTKSEIQLDPRILKSTIMNALHLPHLRLMWDQTTNTSFAEFGDFFSDCVINSSKKIAGREINYRERYVTRKVDDNYVTLFFCEGDSKGKTVLGAFYVEGDSSYKKVTLMSLYDEKPSLRLVAYQRRSLHKLASLLKITVPHFED